MKDDSGLKGKMRITAYKAGTKEVVYQSEWIKNLIMEGSGGYGTNLIARRLIGETTWDIAISHAKIGTGTTAVAETQTNLITPTVNSIEKSYQVVSGANVAHLEFFISDTDLANGTYNEFGLFVGTYGVDERMFSRVIISPAYTKATNTDTSIEYDITVNN